MIEAVEYKSVQMHSEIGRQTTQRIDHLHERFSSLMRRLNKDPKHSNYFI